jgi:hypothetical protein
LTGKCPWFEKVVLIQSRIFILAGISKSEKGWGEFGRVTTTYWRHLPYAAWGGVGRVTNTY